jgi:hypothetical protein
MLLSNGPPAAWLAQASITREASRDCQASTSQRQAVSASLRVRRLRQVLRQRQAKVTLTQQLCEVLAGHVGERGHNEGAVDVLCRIIAERDRAMTLLALDRMKPGHE